MGKGGQKVEVPSLHEHLCGLGTRLGATLNIKWVTLLSTGHIVDAPKKAVALLALSEVENKASLPPPTHTLYQTSKTQLAPVIIGGDNLKGTK